jgi:hypothetical protein
MKGGKDSVFLDKDLGFLDDLAEAILGAGHTVSVSKTSDKHYTVRIHDRSHSGRHVDLAFGGLSLKAAFKAAVSAYFEALNKETFK